MSFGIVSRSMGGRDKFEHTKKNQQLLEIIAIGSNVASLRGSQNQPPFPAGVRNEGEGRDATNALRIGSIFHLLTSSSLSRVMHLATNV